jgi:hypothetical protein
MQDETRGASAQPRPAIAVYKSSANPNYKPPQPALVRVEKAGRNIYRVHRADRECFGEEYMIVRQRGGDVGNVHINTIYVLKRFMLWVRETDHPEKPAVRRMVPHAVLADVLRALGYPADSAVTFSQNGVAPRAIPDTRMLPTLHQTLRAEGVNTIHVATA